MEGVFNPFARVRSLHQTPFQNQPGRRLTQRLAAQNLFALVQDHPGELARLLADAVDSEVNVEDIRIDHDPGRPVGLVELVVEDSRAEHLLGSLESRGWETHR